MNKFLIVRLSQSLFALWAISVFVFLLVRLTGSPIDALLPDDASPDQILALTQKWRLDQPIIAQYWHFLINALQGDFGESLSRRGYPAMQVVLSRLPATLELAGIAIVMSAIIAIPLGVLAAVYKRTFIDSIANVIALFGQSLPQFWLGIILIWIFAVWLSHQRACLN